MSANDWLESILDDRWPGDSKRLLASHAGAESGPAVRGSRSTASDGDPLPPSGLLAVDLYAADSQADGRQAGTPERERRLRLCSGSALSLSTTLPRLADFGVDVLDERSEYVTTPAGGSLHLVDLGLSAPTPEFWKRIADPGGRDRFASALESVWSGRCASDQLNSLILSAGSTWRQVAVLRAYTSIVSQVALSYSRQYVLQVLSAKRNFAVLAVELFEAMHDPDRYEGVAGPERAQEAQRLNDRYNTMLEDVALLDEDRILRALLHLVNATTRTNAFRRGPVALTHDHVALKLDASTVPELPSPHPFAEIWVHGPRVEGVHMRFGAVARGGLRWSDRQEDVRTEVLGLVTAQVAKNALIVPTGAKGGFVPQMLPDPNVDRAAWMTMGVAAYRTFVASMLDLTDNRDLDGAVIPAPRVVRHDGDDSYLVVAADKGTATFSDHANAVAREHGYWLGDAFASGGSNGFDHKQMGITARGVWESVKRHFHELGVDASNEEITVVGIGDMSGDVFGNGLLSSQHLRLVAAFDHRHIFIDPNPDPGTSYAERRRLFALPRSSWSDYAAGALSPGGAVHRRDSKSIKLSVEAARFLDLDPRELHAPAEVIKAILCCRADLLWNGGIGTYVKARSESHQDVGDHANDAIRVDGAQLRVRVAAEGGNLGFTRDGRIEAAQCGVRLNSDAIDNAAGVATSDLEVNIKIALDHGVWTGNDTAPDRHQSATRNDLLASLTDQVAATVLQRTYDQNLRLSVERTRAEQNFATHRRLVRALAASPVSRSADQHLPSSRALRTRETEGTGLTSPELGGLTLAVKNALKADVVDSDLPDDPWLQVVLSGYFPPALQRAAPAGIAQHPLRREIVASQVVNDVIDRAGIAAVFMAVEETGYPASRIVGAFVAAIEIFGHRDLTRAVQRLDGLVPAAAQLAVLYEGQRLLERAARWIVNLDSRGSGIAELVERYKELVSFLSPTEPARLVGSERDAFRRNRQAFATWGLPEDLADTAARYLDSFVLLDVVDIAARSELDPTVVSGLYHMLSDRLGIDFLLTRVSMLPREGRWDGPARAALREDLYNALRDMTSSVIERARRHGVPEDQPQTQLGIWEQQSGSLLAATRSGLEEAVAAGRPGLAQLSVVVGRLRILSRTV
jgi:glutamate dehydrogenase